MILEHKGALPTIDPDVRIAPNAVICGDVTIGPNCSIGFGAVITAESGPVRIGPNCVIMDTAVIRGVRNNPVEIRSNVLVGPPRVKGRPFLHSSHIAVTASVSIKSWATSSGQG